MSKIRKSCSLMLATVTLLWPFFEVWSQDQLLDKADIRHMMEQLFKKHVTKKAMTPEIVQHAIRIYIEQFDPHRIYLLDREVMPWLQLTPEQLNTVLAQYNEDDVSAFQKLDNLIQRAIEREQQLRQGLRSQLDALFTAAAKLKVEDSKGEEEFSWASNVDVLERRLRAYAVEYIYRQIDRYGKADVMKNKESVFNNFVEEEREYELPYLYFDEEGHPLSLADRENKQTLRILKAFASSLDSHTSIYNPEEAYNLRVRLEKSLRGIGILVHRSGTFVTVDKVLPGSPAAQQGLIAVGDRLITINGKEVSTIPFEELLDMLQGEHATKVNLVLQHKGGVGPGEMPPPYSVQLAPSAITINDGRAVTSFVSYGDGIIGTIVLPSFYKSSNGITSEGDVRHALDKLRQEGQLKGLILDLRGNPGGFLTQAVKVAGLFITSGVVVISKYANGDEHFYRDMDGEAAYQGPLVVLTSKTTASAAEIVAQALQDYGVAVIVGDAQTYGKGTIQSQTVTDNQDTASYFKVTVGKYYTVSGKTPQKQGVKADIIAPGELSLDNIGERYDESSPDPDSIPPSYSDGLTDINVLLKPWFKYYYLPTLQVKQQEWSALLPELRKRSLFRLQSKGDYVKFTELLKQKDNLITLSAPEVRNWHDLQHKEAIDVVKDMIVLDGSLKGQGSPVLNK